MENKKKWSIRRSELSISASISLLTSDLCLTCGWPISCQPADLQPRTAQILNSLDYVLTMFVTCAPHQSSN